MNVKHFPYFFSIVFTITCISTLIIILYFCHCRFLASIVQLSSFLMFIFGWLSFMTKDSFYEYCSYLEEKEEEEKKLKQSVNDDIKNYNID